MEQVWTIPTLKPVFFCYMSNWAKNPVLFWVSLNFGVPPLLEIFEVLPQWQWLARVSSFSLSGCSLTLCHPAPHRRACEVDQIFRDVWGFAFMRYLRAQCPILIPVDILASRLLLLAAGVFCKILWDQHENGADMSIRVTQVVYIDRGVAKKYLLGTPHT